jgi:uncharacterized DUF497 family protein
MNDELFDWDSANICHIAEHDITPEEAEEVILGDPLEMDFERRADGEDRWTYIGETKQAQVLQVVIALRGDKIRVVTAYQPTRRDKLLYLATKGGQHG